MWADRTMINSDSFEKMIKDEILAHWGKKKQNKTGFLNLAPGEIHWCKNILKAYSLKSLQPQNWLSNMLGEIW